MASWSALTGSLRRHGGLWQYLIARSADQTAFSLERERNDATGNIIRTLPPGGELIECERGGRLRVIRMPPVSRELDAVRHGSPTDCRPPR